MPGDDDGDNDDQPGGAAASAPAPDGELELPPHRHRRWRRHPVRTALLVLLGAALVALAAWWPAVTAQVRAAVVLATVLEVPLAQGPVEALTGEPRIDEDAELASTPTSIFHPAGEGPWPAVLFITGADASGRRQDDVVRLGEGLARAGLLVVVPDLPGMRDGRLGPETIEAGREVTRAAAALDDARDGRVALVSVSAGASLALVIAADDDIEPLVSVVAGIAPYADVRTAVEVATTGAHSRADGSTVELESTEWMETAVARSLFAADEGSPRLEALEQEALERDRPIDYLQELPARELPSDPSGVLALLRTTDPERFDARWEELPGDVRDSVDRFSPLGRVAGLDVPIELASAPKDKYFPLSESRTIVERAPQARLTVTATLDHAIPEASLDELGDLLAFDAFVVRVLMAAQDPDAG